METYKDTKNQAKQPKRRGSFLLSLQWKIRQLQGCSQWDSLIGIFLCSFLVCKEQTWIEGEERGGSVAEKRKRRLGSAAPLWLWRSRRNQEKYRGIRPAAPARARATRVPPRLPQKGRHRRSLLSPWGLLASFVPPYRHKGIPLFFTKLMLADAISEGGE